MPSLAPAIILLVATSLDSCRAIRSSDSGHAGRMSVQDRLTTKGEICYQKQTTTGAMCLQPYKCAHYPAPVPAGVSAGVSTDSMYFTLGGFMCRDGSSYVVTNEHNLIGSNIPEHAQVIQPSQSHTDNAGSSATIISPDKAPAIAHHNFDYVLLQVEREIVGDAPTVMSASAHARIPVRGFLNREEILAEIAKGSSMHFSARLAGWCGVQMSDFELVTAAEDFMCGAVLYPGLGGCLKLKDSVEQDNMEKSAGSNCEEVTDLCYPGNSGSIAWVQKEDGAYAVAMLANSFSYLQPIYEIADVLGGSWSMCEPK